MEREVAVLRNSLLHECMCLAVPCYRSSSSSWPTACRSAASAWSAAAPPRASTRRCVCFLELFVTCDWRACDLCGGRSIIIHRMTVASSLTLALSALGPPPPTRPCAWPPDCDRRWHQGRRGDQRRLQPLPQEEHRHGVSERARLGFRRLASCSVICSPGWRSWPSCCACTPPPPCAAPISPPRVCRLLPPTAMSCPPPQVRGQVGGQGGHRAEDQRAGQAQRRGGDQDALCAHALPQAGVERSGVVVVSWPGWRLAPPSSHVFDVSDVVVLHSPEFHCQFGPFPCFH